MTAGCFIQLHGSWPRRSGYRTPPGPAFTFPLPLPSDFLPVDFLVVAIDILAADFVSRQHPDRVHRKPEAAVIQFGVAVRADAEEIVGAIAAPVVAAERADVVPLGITRSPGQLDFDPTKLAGVGVKRIGCSLTSSGCRRKAWLIGSFSQWGNP